ncbi:hypothetical protein AY599_10505 [Leptolyngbya valderiana BDU 20041]|nr:hypothetical protein AY599_10505 [Leptolyngbya valderiana BDU 20041]
MSLVVELISTETRETARTETQREMNMALSFISTDLREAVYVYDGDCLARQNQAATVCSGLFANNYIPTPENSVPILAFWKLEELPEAVKDGCRTNRGDLANYTIGGNPVPCIAGRAYTLVVYYLSRNDSGDPTWPGKARILRYTLSRYNRSGGAISGYVDPTQNTSFESWPLDNGGNNLQDGSPSLRENPAVPLVDFVDDRAMNEIPELVDAGGASVECPQSYVLTPSDATLDGSGFSGMRNFYGCVRDEISRQSSSQSEGEAESQTAFNQKVILFLRGNAAGKPGIRNANEGFMPAIQTQVLNRGVRNKKPSQQLLQ